VLVKGPEETFCVKRMEEMKQWRRILNVLILLPLHNIRLVPAQNVINTGAERSWKTWKSHGIINGFVSHVNVVIFTSSLHYTLS